MADTKNPIRMTIKCQYSSFSLDLAAECFVDQVPGLVAKLKNAGVEAANSPYIWPPNGGGIIAVASRPTSHIYGVVKVWRWLLLHRRRGNLAKRLEG